MSLDDDLEKLATAAISDWPAITLCGQLDAAIQGLYRTHLPFPPSWTPDEHEEFIKEHADTDAQQLATQFDDTIDTDGDGMKEILDAWGNPIEFLRWAPGLRSLIQDGDPAHADPFDPRGVYSDLDGDDDLQMGLKILRKQISRR